MSAIELGFGLVLGKLIFSALILVCFLGLMALLMALTYILIISIDFFNKLKNKRKEISKRVNHEQ